MPSLSPKDRVPLCLFTFEDGRRCRTPRTGRHPHFCFYHAQKEARSQAADKLAKDLASFFSGDYLSACDLSTALSRLLPAVVRGDIKPKRARTIAYMVQTLIQTIRLSQDEYINAFSTDGWRKAVRKSVHSNFDYRFPPGSGSEQPVPHQPAERQTQSPAPPPQRPHHLPPPSHAGLQSPYRNLPLFTQPLPHPLQVRPQTNPPQPTPSHPGPTQRPLNPPSRQLVIPRTPLNRLHPPHNAALRMPLSRSPFPFPTRSNTTLANSFRTKHLHNAAQLLILNNLRQR